VVFTRITKTNIKIVVFSVFLIISIVYFGNIIKLFFDTRIIDSSPEASIEQYLSSNTKEYKIINITLREQKVKFRERMYIIECVCNFKNEVNKGTQKYIVYLIEDIGWIVTKIEMIKNL
jgi:hypothetical protein